MEGVFGMGRGVRQAAEQKRSRDLSVKLGVVMGLAEFGSVRGGPSFRPRP